MHDPLSVVDLVHWELEQRRQSGYDVSAAAAELAAAAEGDLGAFEAIYATLLAAPRALGWSYVEPDGLTEILAELPTAGADPTALDVDRAARLPDRILGGWLGRIAGCNLGKPIEDGDHWTPEHIRAYLELADAYPLRDYIPLLEPMPAGFQLRDCWPDTTRGRVHGSARDDDIDYSILALWLLEQHGLGLQPDHLAAAMLAFLPYSRVFTAERTAMVNLLHSVPIDDVADVRNPYREWIGALIRADVYGWALPGRPRQALRLVYADASLTHRANGVYGALWAAALVSAATVADSVRSALDVSLTCVPARSRLAEALSWVVASYESGCSWDETLPLIRARYGHYGWVHTVNNGCLITAGLLWGEGDYAATVGLTVQGGWDTDSNGATAGSVVGTVLGAERLPAQFVEPLRDRTRSAVFGHDQSKISDLAGRTLQLARNGLR